MNEDEVRELLRAKIREAGSLRKLAQKIGVSPSYVSQVINGIRAPEDKILVALWLSRKVGYERIKEPNA